MTRRKDKHWKRVAPGAFDRKRITFADTDQIEAYGALASRFMLTVFDLEPGDYFITDESGLMDFIPMDESDTSAIWARIEENYGIREADVGSGLLIKVLGAIVARKVVQ